MYFSFFTLLIIELTILLDVSTPTSEVIKTSSKFSRTSSSILDFPTIDLESFEKIELLVLDRPLSKFSFCSDEKKRF